MGNSNTQFFDWGQVEWIYEPENTNSSNVMNIGIYTILPGKGQKRHIHYGDEQLLYVLSGKGKQLIGDLTSIKETGSLFHIEAGSSHETINIGEEPLRELVISIPANYESKLFSENKEKQLNGNRKKYGNSIQLNDEIKNIYDGFADSLKIPISIFDKEGNVVIEGKGYPTLCENKCSINKSVHNCYLYGMHDKYALPHYMDPSAFICNHGLSVIIMPVIYNDEVIGIIKGGHINISPDNMNDKYNVFGDGNDSDITGESTQFFSKASIKAILLQIKKLNKYIVNDYVLKNTKFELDIKEEIIQDITRHEVILEESLKSTQEKVLSIQINNHFLFNTLNAIASLAVKENAYKTYGSIINLSKMFRYTLKTNSNLSKLKDEIDYLTDYIDLQKLRYGNRLKVVLNISPEIENMDIPFNCLQPILENSFIHGFKNKKSKMLIEVFGKKFKNAAIVEICDNGAGMDEKAVEDLNMKIHRTQNEKALSGLMMIYAKLELFYKENFTFEIYSSPDTGTKVRIVLPVILAILPEQNLPKIERGSMPSGF